MLYGGMSVQSVMSIMWMSLPSVPWMQEVLWLYTAVFIHPLHSKVLSLTSADLHVSLQILNFMLDEGLMYQIYTLNIQLSVISLIIFKHTVPFKFLFHDLAPHLHTRCKR
jgi:hypothetical protein